MVCNDVKISQILLNLINNARDAIVEAAPAERWIKVEMSFVEDGILLNVIDSGPGIPEELKSKVMSSFVTTKEVGKGTGLGLSLVDRFAKEHDGKAFINEDFSNTCFSVFLPLNSK